MVVTTGRGVRTATGTGTLAALVLVLAFGNPSYHDWAARSTDANSALGFFLRELGWPGWTFSSAVPLRDLIAADLKAILLIAFTAMFLMVLPGSQLSSARGTLSGLFAGWGSYIFAGALAGFLAAFLQAHASLLGAYHWAADGAVYGLFAGWIVGLATLGARRT
ncbi:MAG TPA: hypothetical protein VF054_19715 [Micromonosporaceae bacterium]